MKTIKEKFTEMFGEIYDDNAMTNKIDGVYIQYEPKYNCQWTFDEPMIAARLGLIGLSSFDDDMDYIGDKEKEMDYKRAYHEIFTLIGKVKLSVKLNNDLIDSEVKLKKTKI